MASRGFYIQHLYSTRQKLSHKVNNCSSSRFYSTLKLTMSRLKTYIYTRVDLNSQIIMGHSWKDKCPQKTDVHSKFPFYNRRWLCSRSKQKTIKHIFSHVYTWGGVYCNHIMRILWYTLCKTPCKLQCNRHFTHVCLQHLQITWLCKNPKFHDSLPQICTHTVETSKTSMMG